MRHAAAPFAGPVAAFLVALMAIVLATGATASCKRPDEAIKALYSHTVTPDKIDRRMFGLDGQALQWVLVSSEGPPDGAVFVYDCAGHKLAEKAFGYVHTVGPGPLGAGTLTLRYVPGSGTGISLTSVAILRYRNGAISQIFDHALIDDAAIGAGMPDSSYRYRVRIAAHVIRVSGTLRTGVFGNDGWNTLLRGRTVRLPEERYCYNSRRDRFIACRRSP